MITKDNPDLKCPECERPVIRKGAYRADENDPRLQAVLADGTCGPCWAKHQPPEWHEKRKEVKRYKRRIDREKRAPLTEDDVRRLREVLRDMECDRLARGIPPEGVSPRDWAHGNGGLYASDIP